MDSNENIRATTSNTTSSDYCDGTWLPKIFKDMKERIHNFDVRDDDIWVCSFPKTGTTWIKEMAWCISNDLNFERAEENLLTRFSWLEGCAVFNPKNSPITLKTLLDIEEMPSPRFISCHLPYHLLPRQLTEGRSNAKIVYVCRNPKDTCISFYHFIQLTVGYRGTFEDYCNHFLDDTITFGPFWKHVIGFWERKEFKNILFHQYEDMKKDLRQAIEKTATFLNKSFNEEQIRQLEDHLSFDKMKSNPAVNHEKMFDEFIFKQSWGKNQVFQKFMRKGETGQWKAEMSTDLIKKFDEWTNINLDQHPDLKQKFS